MLLTATHTSAQPMLYVQSVSDMSASEVERLLRDGFDRLSAFMRQARVQPQGPPLGIYRLRRDGRMDIRLGFPVRQEDTGRATRSVRAGATPRGAALKAVHLHDTGELGETYRLAEAEMQRLDIHSVDLVWEVYLDGGSPAGVSKTEIYFRISSPDARKLARPSAA
jgi:hypothetical protein